MRMSLVLCLLTNRLENLNYSSVRPMGGYGKKLILAHRLMGGGNKIVALNSKRNGREKTKGKQTHSLIQL